MQGCICWGLTPHEIADLLMKSRKNSWCESITVLTESKELCSNVHHVLDAYYQVLQLKKLIFSFNEPRQCF